MQLFRIKSASCPQLVYTEFTERPKLDGTKSAANWHQYRIKSAISERLVARKSTPRSASYLADAVCINLVCQGIVRGSSGFGRKSREAIPPALVPSSTDQKDEAPAKDEIVKQKSPPLPAPANASPGQTRHRHSILSRINFLPAPALNEIEPGKNTGQVIEKRD
uniref:Uncharacterized protein n=1 Tax=Caenorhabditis japonica TaxID=281687 RepID=A0A8R1ELV0_CAEJA